MIKRIKKIMLITTPIAFAIAAATIASACAVKEVKPSVREIDASKLSKPKDEKPNTNNQTTNENTASDNQPEAKPTDEANNPTTQPDNTNENQPNPPTETNNQPNTENQPQENPQATEIEVTSIRFVQNDTEDGDIFVELNKSDLTEAQKSKFKLVVDNTTDESVKQSGGFNSIVATPGLKPNEIHFNLFDAFEVDTLNTITKIVYDGKEVKLPTTGLTFKFVSSADANNSETPENTNSATNEPQTNPQNQDNPKENTDSQTPPSDISSPDSENTNTNTSNPTPNDTTTNPQTSPNSSEEISILSIEYFEIGSDEVRARITINRILNTDEERNIKVILTEMPEDAEATGFNATRDASDRSNPTFKVDFFFLEPNKQYTIQKITYKGKELQLPTQNLSFTTTQEATE